MIELLKNCTGVYIGDPCYALADDIYHGIWGDRYNYNDGVVKEYNKVYALIHGTEIGDGCYDTNEGTALGVDSGTLGIVPLEFCNKDSFSEQDGIVIKFNEPEDTTAILDYNDGEFMFKISNSEINKVITCNTGIDDMDDDYDEEDY